MEGEVRSAGGGRVSKTVRHPLLNGYGQDLSSAKFEKMAAEPYEHVERAVVESGPWEKGSAKPLVIKQPAVPTAKHRFIDAMHKNVRGRPASEG
jgi:hypothetical protein